MLCMNGEEIGGPGQEVSNKEERERERLQHIFLRDLDMVL